jgi:hypothetical protein
VGRTIGCTESLAKDSRDKEPSERSGGRERAKQRGRQRNQAWVWRKMQVSDPRGWRVF